MLKAYAIKIDIDQDEIVWAENEDEAVDMFCVKIGDETVCGDPKETRDQAQKDLDELFQTAANSQGDYLMGEGAEDVYS